MLSLPRRSAIPAVSEATRALQAAADDVAGLFVGPMPVKQFLDRFLPPRTDPPVTLDAFEKLLDLPKSLDEIGKDMVVDRMLNGVAKLLPSWLVTHAQEPDSICDMSVDIGVYPKGLATTARTDLSQVELFINVDPNRFTDPFDDSKPSPSVDYYYFEREHKNALSRRVNDSFCVGAMGVLQARTHTFSVLVFGTSARLLRWDASGVLVTRAFSYTNTDWLIEFLWRFDALSPSERGVDTSISLLDEPWPTHFAPKSVLERLQGTSPASTRHRCFATMKIPDRDTASTEHDFLVSWPPRYTKSSPFGRATRPMLAYNIKARKLVFAKQYWRVDNNQKEGEVYRRLADHGVRRLPVFGAGNDVRGIGTITQMFEPPDERPGWHRPTRHMTKYLLYRMSLDTIGNALSGFKSTRQLVTAVRDAMICHDDAFFKAGILHGDISPGNIMIHPDDDGGFLTDWDSAIDVQASEESGAPRRGTWQFMSAALLRRISDWHELRDDRESMFWVLLWNALVHTSYSSSRSLDSWMILFDERVVDSVGPVGGDFKLKYFRYPTMEDSIESTVSPWVNTLIPRLMEFFAIRYTEGLINPQSTVTQLFIASGRRVNLPTVAEYNAWQDQKASLSKKGTIIDILNEALDDPTLWPDVDDPALPDISLYGKPLSRKRSADLAGLRDAHNPPKPSPPRPPVASPTNPTRLVAKPRKKVVVPPSDRVLRPRPSPPAPTPPTTTRKKPVKPSEPKPAKVPTKKRDAPVKSRSSRNRT